MELKVGDKVQCIYDKGISSLSTRVRVGDILTVKSIGFGCLQWEGIDEEWGYPHEDYSGIFIKLGNTKVKNISIKQILNKINNLQQVIKSNKND